MNLFDGNAAHENDNDDLKNIKTYLNKYPKTRDLVNELYRNNTIYLDKNFDTAIKADPYAKLWELYTLYMLKQHPVSIEPNREGSPDFCINQFMDGKRLYIECVCPNIAQESLELSGGDFTSKMDPVEEVRPGWKERIGFVGGTDHNLLSRITSSFRDKSKKFEEYIFGKDKSVEIDSYKVLLINGYRLCNRLPKEELRYVFTDHVEEAIYGEEEISICKNTGNIHIQQKEIIMEKNEDTTIIAKENPKYIRHFDAIGAMNLAPFGGTENITLFPIKENSTKFYEELKKLLTCPYLP